MLSLSVLSVEMPTQLPSYKVIFAEKVEAQQQ
jgi:hypothetical protein